MQTWSRHASIIRWTERTRESLVEFAKYENGIYSGEVFRKIKDPCACYCYDTTKDLQVIRKVWHIYKNKKGVESVWRYTHTFVMYGMKAGFSHR